MHWDPRTFFPNAPVVLLLFSKKQNVVEHGGEKIATNIRQLAALDLKGEHYVYLF